MNKSDFKKGQRVYLFVIEGSNAHRYIKDKPFSERIVPATVTSVGRKYISTTIDGRPLYSVKFDIDNNFHESVDCGGMNYQLFLSEQDIYDYQETETLYKEIRQSFDSWKNVGKYSLEQLRAIKDILSESTTK